MAKYKKYKCNACIAEDEPCFCEVTVDAEPVRCLCDSLSPEEVHWKELEAEDEERAVL